jgi:hypothetical protein
MDNVNIFIKDWKELQEAMKPIPDNDDPKKIINEKKSFFQLDWKSMKKVLVDSKDLYYLTLTDKDAAIKVIQDDEIYIKLRKEAKEKSTKEQTDFDDNDFRKNVEDIIKDFKSKHKDVSMNSIIDKKKQVSEMATDRLEVMGTALREFMEGYREGKETSMKQTLEDKSLDHYIDGITNMETQDSINQKEISKNVKKEE